ncbi:MAG: DEAD/DEAH box helicase [Sedimentisphaerales bacterium]|nr:DEAD/DEAH box helicase [Sedimentisphaerales bacterium]
MKEGVIIADYTKYHCQYWANALTVEATAGSFEGLSRSIANARVDLNPHQVDAALFALRSPLSYGAVLADEVGLGKTIEAGIVIAQKWAERKRKVLLIVPAALRKQWQQELETKFYLPTVILDSKIYKEIESTSPSPFLQNNKIVICSYHFASAKDQDIVSIPWDMVVVDEAHRLRNVYKSSSKLAKKIKNVIGSSPKLLLTATPLQNSLMELYGLTSVIDEHIFGDPISFRYQFIHAISEATRNVLLKQRLENVCRRTLRKQVTEYIPFTNRVLITQDFTPHDKEQQLYESISTYLQKDQLYALPASQRNLITLVLRKLLASSTFAIAGTLKSLVWRLDNLAKEIKLFDDEDIEDIDELEDELEESVDEASESTTPLQKEKEIDPELLKQEIVELKEFARLAESVKTNAKGEALPVALKIAVEKAVQLGAQRKAVIFTESRRTQQYLYELLSENGYNGKLAMINGSNNDPVSKQIYKDWLTLHEGQDIITGSKSVDIKAAIVEYFQDQADILIATEAAAEGVNLQFCSLVVNYDLPWNPQRIEQRIGRCHRYGQKHDVVVVNFINRRNAADRRVHELLREKFHLFEGVFGASDEVLGAIESGVDIERRIAEVYQKCRTTEEIEAAFDALQTELDEQIQSRMAQTRSSLLENLDEEVAARLRINKDKTLESLNQRQRWLFDLTRTELNGQADFDDSMPRFYYKGQNAHKGWYNLDWKKAEENNEIFYRQDHPLASGLIEAALERKLTSAELKFDYSAYGAKLSALEPFIGSSGTLELHKLTVEALDVEQFLVFAAKTDDGRVIDEELCQKLMLLPASVKNPGGTATSLDNILQVEINKKVELVDIRNGKFFEEEVIKLDRWSEDLKKGLEQEIKEMDKEIRQARKDSKLAASLSDKLKFQKQIKQLEQSRNKKRRELFDQQDKIDIQRDELIEKIERQLKQRHETKNTFTIRWEVE